MRPKLTRKIGRRRSPNLQGHRVVKVQVVRLRDKVTKPLLVMHNQVALDAASHMQKKIVVGSLEHALYVANKVTRLRIVLRRKNLRRHQPSQHDKIMGIKGLGIKGGFMHSLNRMPTPLMP